MVSHQTATIQQTCEIGILIKDGKCIDTFDIKADRNWQKYARAE
jgi:ABC-type polysaccharide/polyol phosphate transport system ATPase subunit